MKKKINGNCLELPDLATKFINKKFENPPPPDMIKLRNGRGTLEYVLYTFLFLLILLGFLVQICTMIVTTYSGSVITHFKTLS